MWSDRAFLSIALAALVTPAAANYAQSPFHERPFEIADLALTVLDSKEPVTVPTDDVPLAAAVAAFLLISELGLAEAFEEAVEEKEDEAYAKAYALLQTVWPWVAAVPQDAEVEDLMARLAALMPTAERPERLDADPEAAEVMAQALVGQMERAANVDLYLGRDLARAIDTVARLAAEGCARGAEERARWFEVTAIYFEDALEAPLSVMASEEAEAIEEGIEALQAGDLSACEVVTLAFDQANRRLFP